MALNIEQGLFKFDFTDHHAVLGVALDATANDVRKRYLKISRRLHPDSCRTESEELRQQASQLFAKLVNPAYEQLFADQTRAEHNALLSRISKRLVQEKDKVQIQSELAKKLSKAGNIEQEYQTALQSLAEKQYESIDRVLDNIAQISELNLVYLQRKAGQGATSRPAQPAAQPAPTAGGAGISSTAKPGAGMMPSVDKKVEKPENSAAEAYCRRAEEYLEKNVIPKAILELKDALKMEPNSSRCHGLLAIAYLRQDQMTMAKVHMNQAFKLNPQEPKALEVKKLMEKIADKAAAAAKKKQAEKSGGGLFGLFGKKTVNNEKKK
ncbi:MAG TPA: DnaJ domain-containing protein [Leptolyngbyaceae cyanobacterium]